MRLSSQLQPTGMGGPGGVDEARVRRLVNWRLLPLLFMLALLCQMDRANLAFAALQMDGDLGFSRTVHGLGAGLFFVGYLAQMPAQLVCVAIGARRWLTIILLVWGAVASCFAAVKGRAGFLTLRLLLGLTEAGAFPAIFYHLSLFYDPRRLGVAYTWVATATAVAGLLGGLLAAALLSLDGVGGLRGWQWVFLAEGFPPMVLGVVIYFVLPNSPLSATFLTPDEREWLWWSVRGGEGAGLELVPLPQQQQQQHLEQQEDVEQRQQQQERLEEQHFVHAEQSTADEEACVLNQQSSSSSSNAKPPAAAVLVQRPGMQHAPPSDDEGGLSRETVRAGLCDLRVWYLGAVMLAIDFGMNAANFWIPQVVQAVREGEEVEVGEAGAQRSHSTREVVLDSLLSALPFAGAACAMVANAYSAKRRGERRMHTALPLAAAAVALAALPSLEEVAGAAGALVGLTLAASGIWATHGPFFSWPAEFLEPRTAALAFALMKTCGALGGFAGPLVVGVLADEEDGAFGLALLAVAGVCATASLLVSAFDGGGRWGGPWRTLAGRLWRPGRAYQRVGA